MKKTELYNKASDILSQYEDKFKSKKAFEEFKSQIDELLKPKSGGGVVQNPMITKDDINYHYCRYTNYYLPESEIVMSNGKSKGYSKKAIALWTKMGRDAKSLQDQAMKLLLDKKFEDGTEMNHKAETMLNDRNKTSMYNSVREQYEDIKLNEVEA